MDRSIMICKALANSLRYRIVQSLCGSEKSVSALAEELRQKQSIVSQQLRILRLSRLVDTKKEGGYVYYRISERKLCQVVRAIGKPD